jgi:hypothetical protein
MDQNVFRNNSAPFGGSALRLNGFNTSSITDGNVSGSCYQLQNIINSNNKFELSNSKYNSSYAPDNYTKYTFLD